IQKGDEIRVKYNPTGEYIDLTFATYNKKGMDRDKIGITDYISGDDKTVLCLMVDIEEVNKSINIPFLRTLFKSSKWYQHQLLRRTDLSFIIKENNQEFEYFSVDF